MAETKNLCAQISIDLHRKICDAKDQAGLTTAQYITNLLTEYFEMKENGGTATMTNNRRTMAFQIPEELFQRLKAHLDRETARTGRKLTQREFVLGLIEQALNEAERQVDVGLCGTWPDGCDPRPQEHDDPALLSAETPVHTRNKGSCWRRSCGRSGPGA